MKKIAISLGDLNGIGLEIALREHENIKNICMPIYCISEKMLNQGIKKLKMAPPKDIILSPCKDYFNITPSKISKKSGIASYNSFKKALKLTKNRDVDAMVTLPIHKKAWQSANIPYKGHTDALSKILKQDGIMMIGCDKLFTALYTHHIRLKDVPSKIEVKKIYNFLMKFHKSIKQDNIVVLGVNPHAGDNGALGNEDREIKKAVILANKKISKKIYTGPISADTAFLKKNKTKYIISMYHDQALPVIKTLYFKESINITLGLRIIRTSVDHGTAFNIAYKNKNPSTQSYFNAVKKSVEIAKIN